MFFYLLELCYITLFEKEMFINKIDYSFNNQYCSTRSSFNSFSWILLVHAVRFSLHTFWIATLRKGIYSDITNLKLDSKISLWIYFMLIFYLFTSNDVAFPSVRKQNQNISFDDKKILFQLSHTLRLTDKACQFIRRGIDARMGGTRMFHRFQ